MQTGVVFDIQRFALHDGPGIRTVVFLKGCPLQCRWCCNPESILYKPQLAYYSEKCLLCGTCINLCPENVFKLINNELLVNFNKCTACGICTEECPSDALRIIGRKMSVEEVMTEVEKDIQYYKNSDGGLTLSGGDPLLQYNFSIAILEIAKGKNIHTAVETAGYAPRKAFERIHKFADLFLFDYKLTDFIKHSAFIGKQNDIILENLHYLNSLETNIHLRCIIIPGFNDNHKHFTAITDLTKRYSSIKKVELLPFHNFGKPKYRQIGKQYRFYARNNNNIDDTSKWVDTLIRMGCRDVS